MGIVPTFIQPESGIHTIFQAFMINGFCKNQSACVESTKYVFLMFLCFTKLLFIVEKVPESEVQPNPSTSVKNIANRFTKIMNKCSRILFNRRTYS